MNLALLNILACPLCKGRLRYLRQGDSERLICRFDHLAYKIEDDIPILIPEKADKLNGE